MELTDYIAPADITERGEGISRKKFLNNENSRYFDIYEMDTELGLTPQEAEIVREGKLPNGVKYISLKVDVPNGNYYVTFNNHDTTRYMTLVYNSPTATILPDAFRPLSTEAIVEILPKSDVRGSLTIKHEFLKQEYRDNPPHLEYDVYNEASEPVTNLQQLPVGSYTIIPKTLGGFRPERTRYQVNITEDNLNPEVEIRWFNIEDETQHPAELEVGITGEPSYSYKDKIEVTLTNKTTKEKFVAEFNMPENNITRISVNRGRYEVTTNLPENYDYVLYSSRANKGDKTQEQPDNLMIQEAYEYLEIELIKRTPAIEKTDTVLEINENVKDLGATYILEEVDELGRVINRYNSSRPKFINLNAEKYVLTVDEVPNGYIAVPRSKDVEIKEGTNSVDVNFYKKARYNIVNMVNGKDAAK